MEHTTYASRLRYLPAADVDDTVVDYDGLDVVGSDGSSVGEVDGFIVDAQAGRLHYIVVDAGGWFRSQRMLVPVGHAALADNRRTLRVDVMRAALAQYPEFRASGFGELSDDEMRRFEDETAAACCPDEEPVAGFGLRRHYAQPDWWTSSPYAHERLRPVEAGAPAVAYADPAHDRQAGERARAHADDASPHLDGRAQPGDVIGIETGGERTHVGDTSEDENRRRRVAERAVGAYDDEPTHSER